jgi:hypothetical protein
MSFFPSLSTCRPRGHYGMDEKKEWQFLSEKVQRSSIFASRSVYSLLVCFGELAFLLDPLPRWGVYNSMPTGFFIWGYMYPLPSFLGVHPNFWGAMYPLTLHLGVQRKLTAFSPRKVVHHAVFL